MSYFIFSNSYHVYETWCKLYSCIVSQARLAILHVVNCFPEAQFRHDSSE